MSHKAPWMICPACHGEGTVDTLGIINPDDFDEDQMEMYMEGAYDRSCEVCKGSGKVREADEDGEPFRLYTRTGSSGQQVHYTDPDDASEHWLRMAEGRC